jgi:hypothetical protein
MRSAYHAACALVLATAAALPAAPPEAPARLKAEPGEIVEVAVKVPAGAEIGYRLVGGKALFRELRTETPGERVFWFNAKTAGTYSVVWWTKGETASTETAVEVGPLKPDPKPDPQPDPPKPDPKPVKVDSVFVVVVEDATAPRTVETARALNDPWWVGLKPRHDFRHYRSNQQPAVDAGYVEAAKPIGFPAVLVLDAKTGEVLRGCRLSNVDVVKSLVSEVAK